MGWYLNPALTGFRAAVDARWPNRDRTSDGTIGDAAHQATASDHNPDPDGSVDAWDMDVDGVDVWACIAAALLHESIQYVIYNRRITSRTWGLGQWHDYTGPSPHLEHVHFNTRTSHENSTAPWLFPGGDQLALSDSDAQVLIWRMDALVKGRAMVAGGPSKGEPVKLVADIEELKTPYADPGFVDKLAKAIVAALVAK